MELPAPTYAWTPLITAHAAVAASAVALGAVVLWRGKGTPPHRWMGRAWVALMGLTALSSFGIYCEAYSWIHGLSVFTLMMLSTGVWAARSGRIRAHRQVMVGTYVWGLIVTGLFTLMPDRLLGHALWGVLLGR
jgi:uncharacterized membrane protein